MDINKYAASNWDGDGKTKRTWREHAKAIDYPYSDDALRKRACAYRIEHPEEFPEYSPESVRVDRESWSESGNRASLSVNTGKLAPLDDLLVQYNVDSDVWRVEKWGTRQSHWEIGAKVDGEITKEPLSGWNIWANFIRIKPLIVCPTIQPIRITEQFHKPPLPTGDRAIRTLIFSDPQIGFTREVPDAKLTPFHDRRVLDLILQLSLHILPDRIDILGDFLDFPMWTDKFLRKPKYEYATQPAICEGHWWLYQFRKANPDAHITLHEGNHDARMENATIAHLRAAAGLRRATELEAPPVLSPEYLLALDQLGIDWIDDYPSSSVWLNPFLRISHGNIASSVLGGTTKKIVEKSDCSYIVGHIHRIEAASRTILSHRGPRSITAISPGCTCHIDGRVPGAKEDSNWQNGCMVVDYHPEKEQFAFTLIPIAPPYLIHDKAVFTARDVLPLLYKDLPEWNW